MKEKTIVIDYPMSGGVQPSRTRFPRCCDTPHPGLHMDEVAEYCLYCMACDATWAVILWEMP